MPEDLNETVSEGTELVFPDDASGKTYRLCERSVYDAAEVRAEMETDIPQYGSWLPVKLDGEDAWLTAPSQLRTRLVEDTIKPNEVFNIREMEKRGNDPSDPYQVELAYPERDPETEGQQAALDD